VTRAIFSHSLWGLKILLACSCLEPGVDGVGDYTRRLAGELNAQGHRCHLLALADPWVKETTAGEFPAAQGVVPWLRLSASESWGERVRQAKHFCASVAPDWISWQIVPYGFDPRGLSFGLGARCQEIAGACRSQVMFHEIWIGEAEQSSLKNKIIGKLQRHIIKDFLHKLQPSVVHTHAPLYQHLLGSLGWQATILPLFGNIPLTTHSHTEWLKEKWPLGWAQFDLADRESWWVFVIFGSIHPEWNADDFWQRASQAAKRAGKKCLLIAIGRPGAAGERILHSLQKHDGDSWQLLQLGPQPEEDISQCLLTADFGLLAVQPEFVFKSGTVAAMIEHGLPIVVTRPSARYPHCPPEVLAIGMKNVTRDFNLEALKKSKAESLLPGVARQLMGDLQKA
jgi:glycosyltransferase involved in cell wall biosynthesis